MPRRVTISAVLSALGLSAIRASWLALAVTASHRAADAADKLVLQLHRTAQFEFAGYYAALWRGFYREAGLEVEINPGAPPEAPSIDPVREIVEGRAQFGTGSVQLLMRAAEGQSLLLLVPIFQQSDARVYYRASGDFSSPGALLNGRIGRLPPSNVLDLELRTALYAEAIDPDKLRSLSTEPGQALADLAAHRVDIIVGSVWELPWQARERGIALKSFNPASYRVEYYGDSLFTLQHLANTDPGMVRRFRDASIRGWGYALQHPDEIAARILAELPVQIAVSDSAGFTRYQAEVARELARYPNVPLGHSNLERWGRIQQSLVKIGEIRRPADLDAFLYNPDAVARSRNDGRAAIIAAAAAVTLFAGAGLLWRWGRGTHLLKQIRRMSLHRRFTRLAAAVSAALEGLKKRHVGMRYQLARLRAVVALVPSGLVRVTRQSAFARGESVAGPRPTNLNATLTTLDRSIRRGVPGSVKCRLSLVPEPWLCLTDPDAIAAATLDLVTAAVADMPAGGDLILGTRQYAIDEADAAELAGSAPGNYVRLTVRDNGAGLSSEHLDRIFDPAATARPAVASAGELARRLGGFVRVESAEGIGTAVHLYFRRVVAAGTGAQHPPESEERAKAAAA
jgi:ABC-type nitrate/sulfonate/bicarbonate transport system substrate-binding protein